MVHSWEQFFVQQWDIRQDLPVLNEASVVPLKENKENKKGKQDKNHNTILLQFLVLSKLTEAGVKDKWSMY